MQHTGGVFRDVNWSGIWPPHSLFAEQTTSTITGTMIGNPVNLSFKKVSKQEFSRKNFTDDRFQYSDSSVAQKIRRVNFY